MPRPWRKACAKPSRPKSIALTRSESLELIARRFGFLQLEGAVRRHSEKNAEDT